MEVLTPGAREQQAVDDLFRRLDGGFPWPDPAAGLLEPFACFIGAEKASIRVMTDSSPAAVPVPIALLDIPAEAGEVYVGRFSQLDPAWRRPRGAAAGPVFADPERPGQWVGAEAGCHDQAQFCEYWRGFLKPFNLVHHAGFYLEEPGGWTLLFDFHRGRRARAFDRLETARMHVVARYLHARVAARWTPALPTRASAAPARLLSAREAEVAAAVAAGLSNKDVAAALDISVRTVENHMRSIFDKLEVGSRTQLAASVLRLYQDMRQ